MTSALPPLLEPVQVTSPPTTEQRTQSAIASLVCQVGIIDKQVIMIRLFLRECPGSSNTYQQFKETDL
jgi:hypothetical protein